MNKKYLWLLLIILIFLDFITTIIGVLLKGKTELNPLTNLLLERDKYIQWVLYSLFILPVFFYGFDALIGNNIILYAFLAIFILTLINNFYQLLL